MARSVPHTLLTTMGFDPQVVGRYAQLRPLSGASLQAVSELLGEDVEQVPDLVRPLVELGLVRVADDRVHVLDEAEAITTLLRREAGRAARVSERLEGLAAAVAFRNATTTRPQPGEVDEVGLIDGEVSSGGNPLQLLTHLIESTRGDLLWLRPDAWQMPRESAMAKVVAQAVATGRRSRAIYPVRALHQAPEALLARARAGEQVRVIADLPTRLFVIGTTHAVLPEPLGTADQPRLLVRQGALVAALASWFELMWERASSVADLDLGEPRRDLRRFLLQQLAAGAKDEQIARSLDLSLRTVRRRIADVMSDLGADSRFQAGVEAVRRGWI
jgi:DNA-binding CsgD family transcriptional regulator